MKSNTPKQSRRVSPLSPSPSRANVRPLSHPREASRVTIAQKKTAGLFSSQAVNGHGALSSQVTDTQYFEQFGVDVSHISPSDSPATPSPRKHDNLPLDFSTPSDCNHSPQSPTFAERIQANYDEWIAQPENEIFWENSWADEDYLGDGHQLDADGYPIDLREPLSPVVKAESLPSPALASPIRGTPVRVKREPDNIALKTFELNPVEQWIIHYVRKTRKGGHSAADGFRRLRDRCQAQEDLLRRLKEIHALSAILD
ncbi:hypothetical protein C8R44DRAFT_730286 [Mycena epipterygia]|nr:hypothetical protein C8R44DRAFT_730286 [Mycena epipterygia]